MKRIPFNDLNAAIFEYNKDSNKTLKEHLLERFDHEDIRNAKDERELWDLLPKIVIRNSEVDDA
jgi:hypothetical protein